MVTKPSKSAEKAPVDEPAVEAAAVEDVEATTAEPTFEEGFTGRWFPVRCECGSMVVSDRESERGGISHAQHLTRLGQAPAPQPLAFTSPDVEDTELFSTAAAPKDGKVEITVETLERLAARAGLSKVDPVA